MDDNTPPEVKALIDDVVERTNIYLSLEGMHCGNMGIGVGAFGSIILGITNFPVCMGLTLASYAAGYVYEETKEGSVYRTRISKKFNDIQSGNIVTTSFIDTEIQKKIYFSPKLVNLNNNHKTNMLDNLPLDKNVIEALLKNPNLTEMGDFYPKIKEKILEIDEIDRNSMLELFNETINCTNKKKESQPTNIEKKLLNALEYPKEYKKSVLAVEAKLSPSYQRNENIKAFINDLEISQTLIDSATPLVATNLINTIMIAGTARGISYGIKQFINQQIPADKKPTPEQINAQIAEIETPLQKLNSILPELTADNVATASHHTFGNI